MDLFGATRWSNAELAEVFGISAQRLGVLCKQGVLPLPNDGLHDPKAAVAAYVRHLKQREAGRSQAGEAVTKMQLDNELRRIKLQRIAKELVPVDRVQKDWFESGRKVRDGLLNLPSRLSGVFAAESKQEVIFELFTREVQAALEALSNGSSIDTSVQLLPLDEPREQDVSAKDGSQDSAAPLHETEEDADPHEAQDGAAVAASVIADEPRAPHGDADRFTTGD